MLRRHRPAAQGLETDLGSAGIFGMSGIVKDPNLSSSAYARVLGDEDNPENKHRVMVNVVRLYYAGYVSMPAAAGMYQSGVNVCQGADIGGVSAKFVRSVPKFNEAVAALRQSMSAIVDDVTEAGDAMLAAAKDYHTTDAALAQLIQQQEGLIPSPGNFAAWSHYDQPDWLIH
jgi:hypothetical protein